MLNVTNLDTYIQECVTQIPSFGKAIMLMDDDEFKLFSGEISKQDDFVLLIAVHLNTAGSGPDDDNISANNKLLFYCVEKNDRRKGYDEYVLGYQTCADALKALFEKFKTDKQDFDKICTANNFDLPRFKIDPVRNYHQTNGYVLEIPLITKM